MLLPIVAALLLAAPEGGSDKPDLSVVHRIKTEAFQNGRVMDVTRTGQRLNGSVVAGR